MLLCTIESAAQTDPLNKIIVNFGGGAVPEIIEDTNELAEVLFADGTRTSETAMSGTFSIQYDRIIASKYSVGVSFIFENVTKDVTVTLPSNATYNDAYKADYLTILMNGSYIYKSKPTLELYGKLGIGVSFSQEKYLRENRTAERALLAYQISPIGIRAGKRVFFQAEAGFGYVGILSIGVGYRF